MFVAMRDQGIWSIGLGRWNGVNLRLHMFFLLFAAFTFYLSWLDATLGRADGAIWNGPMLLLILLFSVIAHECGHLAVANRLGGHTDEIVLGPLGGLGLAPVLSDPQSELAAVVAGPLTNLGICFVAALGLAMRGHVDLVGLMYPLSPSAIEVGDPLSVMLKMTFWINWLLILVNLIPAFPFDGGQALKAAILSLRPETDPQAAVLIVARVAKLTALGLIVIAWMVRHENPNFMVQTWFALVLLAILVFFSARKVEHRPDSSPDEAFLGYDFSAGFTTLDSIAPNCSTKAASGPLVSWWERRRRERAHRKRQQDAVEDGRVDEILLQVHASGVDSLTAEEQAILKRASTRYRNRLQ